jgi:hypothetical protein
MATTYVAPLTSIKDHVRLLVKDNVTGQMILQDEDIEALAAAHPDATPTNRERYLVAFEAATALYGHWLRIASAQVGPLRIEGTRRAEASLAQAQLFWNLGNGLSPTATGGMPAVTSFGLTLVDPADCLEPLFSRTNPP